MTSARAAMEFDPSPTGVAALVCSLLSAGVAAWVALRKQRAADDGTAIGQWREYVRQRERLHAADIQRLARQNEAQQAEIEELREREQRCEVRTVRLEEKIAALVRLLEAHGIKDSTGLHKPPGDQP